MRTRNTMPMCTCPNCEKEWQWDDCYDVKQGTERECPTCGVTVEVLSADVTVECVFGIKGFAPEV